MKSVKFQSSAITVTYNDNIVDIHNQVHAPFQQNGSRRLSVLSHTVAYQIVESSKSSFR